MIWRSPAILALASLGGAAQAEPTTGTLIPDRESSAMIQGSISRSAKPEPGNAAIEGARAMARCMANNHAKETDALLAASDTPSLEAAYRRNKRHVVNCLSMVEVYGDTARIEMRFDQNTVRGLLAEARFRRMGDARLAPIEYDQTAAGSEWISDDPASRATLRTADCLAARQPATVSRILESPPASPVEDTAFAALMPHIGGCLERNIRLSTKKLGLRLALASALDRRMRLPAQSAGSH